MAKFKQQKARAKISKRRSSKVRQTNIWCVCIYIYNCKIGGNCFKVTIFWSPKSTKSTKNKAQKHIRHQSKKKKKHSGSNLIPSSCISRGTLRISNVFLWNILFSSSWLGSLVNLYLLVYLLQVNSRGVLDQVSLEEFKAFIITIEEHCIVLFS